MLRIHYVRPTVLTLTQEAAARPTPIRGGPRMTRQRTMSMRIAALPMTTYVGPGAMSGTRESETTLIAAMSAATTSAAMM